jgi:hypothetical protein
MTNSRVPLATDRSVSASGNSPAALQPRRISWKSIATWAADRESAGARRQIQLALGVIWLVDAALQYQPYMFTRAFAIQVLEPAAAGSPGFVTRPVLFASHLILHSPVFFDALFATIQLAIALGLFWRRTARAALLGSIIWALAIWWLGEALGGTLTGSASPVTGAPGAALLYALIALLAWTSGSRAASVAAGSPVGASWPKLVWLALWGSEAYYLLTAANRAPDVLAATIGSGASGEPGWLSYIEVHSAILIGTQGGTVSVVLAALFAVIAVGVFVPVVTRPVLILAIVVASTIWVLGESFGGILTGQATDLNTGPLLILLAAAYWPLANRPGRPAILVAEPPGGALASGY